MFRIILKLVLTAICFLLGISVFQDSNGNTAFGFIICFLGIAHWIDYDKTFIAKQQSTFLEKFGRKTIIWVFIIIIIFGGLAMMADSDRDRDRPVRLLSGLIELISALLKAR